MLPPEESDSTGTNGSLRWHRTLLLACTVLGSFLLFQVQPLIGRAILPWFGGSASVWSVCLLFFQVSLFAGYCYADIGSRWVTMKWQLAVHLGLVGVALATLPIAPDIAQKPTDGLAPTRDILWILLTSVGLPYFLLAANTPLLSKWWSQMGNTSPYRLYAFSNAGSMAGLLSYPFVVEPLMSTSGQSLWWSSLFVLFAICFAALLATQWKAELTYRSTEVETGAQTTIGRRLAWLFLAGLGTLMLMSVTNFLCQDISSVPFMWVAPLTVYLLSFVLCFGRASWYRRSWCFPLMLVAGLLCAFAHRYLLMMNMWLLIGLFLPALFLACMVCHGELERLKPARAQLTEYYLYLAAGGAVGGLLVAFVAPTLFFDYYELPLGFLATAAVMIGVLARSRLFQAKPWRHVVLWCAVLIIVGLQISHWAQSLTQRSSGTVLSMSRNFYGVLKLVADQNPETGFFDYVSLVHGQTVHGGQFADDSRQDEPTAYFARATAIGQMLSKRVATQPRRIGIVGLGAGTLAAYAETGDLYQFYEIDPAVVQVAERPFTFLANARSRGATIEVAEGDARISLERSDPMQFDVFVIDAFSGDSIPIHLITVEAMQEYMRHLTDEGVVVIHITNRYLDLSRVTAGLAQAVGLEHTLVTTEADPDLRQPEAIWAILSQADAGVSVDSANDASKRTTDQPPIVWSDDRHSLFDVLRK